MALKTIADPTFKRAVTIDTTTLAGTINIEFRARRQKYLLELQAKANAEGRYPELVLVDVVKAWDLEIDGEAIECGAAGVQQLLDHPGTSAKLMGEYYTGLHEARSGNSAPPPSGS